MISLNKLFKGIKYELIKGDMETLISDIVYDSRNVVDDCLFVCINGSMVNGHEFISDAIRAGAKAILITEDVSVSEDVVVIKVDSATKILSKLSLKLFNYPQSKLKTIAITGTKGKTTTSFMIKKIIETSGHKCGLIGTTGIYIGDKFYKANNTTPLAYDTIKYMNEMVNDKIEYMVMEVSSQALKYDRVNDIVFDYGIFTNLTKDHIGENEHDSMEDYINSKAKLFSQSNYGIFNMDDEHFFEIVSKGDAEIHTFGYDDKADLKCEDIKLLRDGDFLGIDMKVSGIINDTIRVSSPGKFSSYNAMAAIMVTYMLGIDVKDIKKALSDFSVRGRCEAVKVSDKFSLLIDYAHNGVSTESILKTIRQYDDARIVTIFGCGGNRSRDRRYEMGEMAGKYSDYCIITEDNNRFEEFDDIASDILVGMKKTNCEYTIIPDRKAAIKYAIENGQAGDVIMLIGKGHEDYKEIKGVKYPFDERVVIKEILDELNK